MEIERVSPTMIRFDKAFVDSAVLAAAQNHVDLSGHLASCSVYVDYQGGNIMYSPFPDGEEPPAKSEEGQAQPTTGPSTPLKCSWCGKSGGKIITKHIHEQCYEAVLNGAGMI